MSCFRLVRRSLTGECDFSLTVVLPGLEAPFTLLGGFRLKEGCVTQANGAGCEKDDQN